MSTKAQRKQLQKKRDEKAIPHLKQYAPVWLVEEQYFVQAQAVQFNVVFQHNVHGWVNRRYRYDAIDNVLYQKGQTAVSEDEVLELDEKEPFVTGLIADTPNAYGG